MKYEDKDTICGIATARGRGGISVIRVSGAQAGSIVASLCPFLPDPCESNRIYYGFIRQFQEKSEVDEVLVSYFAEGRSFTGEQTLEISSHGGEFISQSLILELQKSGARLAERGEFTYRAFMNGRIDLTQAEATLAMIQSESRFSSQLALRQLKGEVSQTFEGIEKQLTYILAHLEASIDFSSEDIQSASYEELLSYSLDLQSKIKQILSTYRQGRQIREGIDISILGEPNVGKSSLFNTILGEDRTIVSAQAGTTRDYVEGKFVIEGFLYYLRDTAGLRETQNEVERLGMERSLKLARESDIVFLVSDLLNSFSHKMKEFISRSPLDKLYFIFNKMDLASEDEHQSLLSQQVKEILNIKNLNPLAEKKAVEERCFPVSATERIGVEDLMSSLEKFSSERYVEDSTIITQARHFEQLTVAYERFSKAIEFFRKNASPEFIVFELQDSLNSIQQVLGKKYDDEVMDRVFKEFCLGK